MQDEKKNREMRCETRKKWRDETQDKKNVETRHETKKKQGDETQ